MRTGEKTLQGVYRWVLLSSASVALVGATGCSFVASSKSSSDIISSPFKSSSNSAGGQDTAYKEQTADYSRAIAEVGGSKPEAFQLGLSDLAARLGISDWESHPATWTSVGRGLGQAQVSGGELISYASNWTGGDVEVMDLVFQGYAQTR